MTTIRIYVLEAQSNDGQWWFMRSLQATNPLTAWSEAVRWIKAPERRWGHAWHVAHNKLNPDRFRIMPYDAQPASKKAIRRFKAEDICANEEARAK